MHLASPTQCALSGAGQVQLAARPTCILGNLTIVSIKAAPQYASETVTKQTG